MSAHAPQPPRPPGEDPLRPHVFDGIAEYDKRLPNWWLITLYGTIVFAIVYWMATQHFRHDDDGARVARTVQELRAAKLAAAGTYDDAALWTMSRTPSIVAAGAAAYQTTCVSCHGDQLQGGIGFNLADATWAHGDSPTAILKTINEGVLVKGMPAWGPVLGPKKTAEVAAFILSKHAAPL
jgi:cytochrome c oxidase cbb3-type subunit 3